MELLENKINKKLIITVIISYLIIFGLYLIGYFYDYQITKALCVLKDGNYYPNNYLLLFLETIGECPVYIFLAIGLAIVYHSSRDFKNKKFSLIFRIILLIGISLLYMYFITRIFKYLGNHFKQGNGVYENHKILVYLFSLCFSLIPNYLTIVLTEKIKKNYYKPLSFLTLIFIVAVIIGPFGSEIIKSIVTRMRYRAIYVLEENGLSSQVVFSQFLHFDKITLTEEMTNLGLTSDIYHSFPSGHSTGASLTLILILLPSFLSLEKKKKKKLRLILIIVSYIYLLGVILSRLLMGAHYLTDVVTGYTLAYTGILIGFIVIKKMRKIFLRFYEDNDVQ